MVKQIHNGRSSYLLISSEDKKRLSLKKDTTFDKFYTQDSIIFKKRAEGLVEFIIPKPKFSNQAETIITILAEKEHMFKAHVGKQFKTIHKRNWETLLRNAISELVGIGYLLEKSLTDPYIWRTVDEWRVL